MTESERGERGNFGSESETNEGWSLVKWMRRESNDLPSPWVHGTMSRRMMGDRHIGTQC